MTVNRSNLIALVRGFRTIFLTAFHAASPMWASIAMEVPSNADTEEYDWLVDLPGMKELVGSATIENLEVINWSIRNKEWEDTIGVKQSDIERDNIGIYTPRFQALAAAAAAHPDELLAQVMVGGFAAKDYTGKNFFDTGKKHFPGAKAANNFDNKTTDALDATAFEAARKRLKSMVNGHGRSMNLGANLKLIVGPSNESTARQILEAEMIGGGNSNINKGAAELMVWPQLAATSMPDSWYLIDTGHSLAPFVFQNEKPTTVNGVTREDDSYVVLNHRYIYQAYGRYNVGYLLPQLIQGSTGAG